MLSNSEIRRYLELLRPSPAKVDFLFVLGSPRPDPAHIATRLFLAGKADRILLTGGIKAQNGESEADFHRNILLDAGIPAEKVLLESRSTNTLENILFARNLPEKRSVSLLAICRWFHSRRVLMTLKRHWPEATCFTELYGDPEDSTQKQKARIEFEKIPIYLARGDIAEI